MTKAEELIELAESLRRSASFGKSINVFRQAIDAPDATEDIKRNAQASIELIQEINGFVNTDLMNP